MGELIDFPKRPLQDWPFFEGVIRNILKDGNSDEQMQDSVCNKMKDFYLKFNKQIEYNFRSSLNLTEEESKTLEQEVAESIRNISKQFQDLISQILFDRLILEIEIYKLKM